MDHQAAEAQACVCSSRCEANNSYVGASYDWCQLDASNPVTARMYNSSVPCTVNELVQHADGTRSYTPAERSIHRYSAAGYLGLDDQRLYRECNSMSVMDGGDNDLRRGPADTSWSNEGKLAAVAGTIGAGVAGMAHSGAPLSSVGATIASGYNTAKTAVIGTSCESIDKSNCTSKIGCAWVDLKDNSSTCLDICYSYNENECNENSSCVFATNVCEPKNALGRIAGIATTGVSAIKSKILEIKEALYQPILAASLTDVVKAACSDGNSLDTLELAYKPHAVMKGTYTTVLEFRCIPNYKPVTGQQYTPPDKSMTKTKAGNSVTIYSHIEDKDLLELKGDDVDAALGVFIMRNQPSILYQVGGVLRYIKQTFGDSIIDLAGRALDEAYRFNPISRLGLAGDFKPSDVLKSLTESNTLQGETNIVDILLGGGIGVVFLQILSSFITSGGLPDQAGGATATIQQSVINNAYQAANKESGNMLNWANTLHKMV